MAGPFVNKLNLETQNPRRDASIKSVSTGLVRIGYFLYLVRNFYTVVKLIFDKFIV